MGKEGVGKGIAETWGPVILLGLGIITGGLIGTGSHSWGATKYPTAPVTIIVPYSAGAASDMLTRLVAAEMAKRWKQPVNVVNKPGGNTIVGTHAALSAVPDGYTLLQESTSGSSAQLELKNLPYDPLKRTFLALAIRVSNTISVSANAPWQNLRELAEAGRKDPPSLVWGASAGGRGDIPLLQFFEAAKIKVTKTKKVDFAGGAPAVNALAGGHINLTSKTPMSIMPLIQSGKARALVISSPKRSRLLPAVPTGAEAGFPNVNYRFWIGFSAPPGLPDPIKDVIVKTIEEILKDPVLEDTLEMKYGGAPVFDGPEAFKKFVLEEANEHKRLHKLLID